MNEYVPDQDWDSVRRNFELLAAGAFDTGGTSYRLRIGVDTLPWPGVAAAASDVKIVNHGLGKTPVGVACFAYLPAGNAVTRGIDIEADDSTFSTTQFTCRGIFGNGVTSTATWPFWWIAIG